MSAPKTAIPLQGPQAPLQVVERVSKQARSIRIEVRPDGEVRLVIPRFVPKRTAYEFLRSREEWIRRKIAELHLRSAAEPRRPPLRWDGTDCRSRCAQRRWKASIRDHPSPRWRGRACAFDGGITVFCSRGSRAAIPPRWARRCATALGELARHQARRLLDEEAARLGVDYHGLRIADQKSLWAAAAPAGRHQPQLAPGAGAAGSVPLRRGARTVSPHPPGSFAPVLDPGDAADAGKQRLARLAAPTRCIPAYRSAAAVICSGGRSPRWCGNGATEMAGSGGSVLTNSGAICRQPPPPPRAEVVSGARGR